MDDITASDAAAQGHAETPDVRAAAPSRADVRDAIDRAVEASGQRAVAAAPWWAGQVWAMEPDALGAMVATPVDLSAFGSFTAPGSASFELRGSDAIVGIHGPLEPRQSLVGVLLGGSDYRGIVAAVEAAERDPRVARIVLDVDSPGGSVAGLSDAAEAIAGAGKPTVAHVSGVAASAAYWLAAAADTINAAEGARVGSLGVMATLVDDSQRDARLGRVKHTFISSQTPGKNAAPGTEDGRAQWQAQVDAMADVFIGAVARNRGVSVETVNESFGRGAMVAAASALERGMVDSVGPSPRIKAPASSRMGATNMANAVEATPVEAGGGDEEVRAQGVEGSDAPVFDVGTIVQERDALAAEVSRLRAENEQKGGALAAQNARLDSLEAQVAEQRERAAQARRDAEFAQFSANGRVKPAERETFMVAAEQRDSGAPEFFIAMFAGRQPGQAVPLGEVGHAVPADAAPVNAKQAKHERIQALCEAEGLGYVEAAQRLAAEGGLK